MRLRVLRAGLIGLTFIAGLVLTGCGSGPSSTGPVSAAPLAASNLNGNWLLAGVLPTQNVLSPAKFGFAMSFAANGNQIYGAGTAQYTCGSSYGSLSFGSLVQGTVADDGTFTAQAPATLGAGGLTVTLQGTVPKEAGEPWSGTYSLDSNPPLTGACHFSQQGAFTATSIASATGKYVGTGTVNSGGLGLTGSPIAVTLNLQQGGNIVSVSGVSAYDADVVSGTIQLAGATCSGTGSTSSVLGTSFTSVGGVEGNRISVSFNMQDGSRLIFGSDLLDTAGSRMGPLLLLDTTGLCGLPTPVSIQVSELDRVP